MATQEQRARRKAKERARKTGITGSEVSKKHDPILNVREFSSVDFSQLAYIMPPEWVFEGLTPDQKTAQANMDFAGVLRRANIRLVATVDDGTDFDPVLVGILLARTEKAAQPADRAFWEQLFETASETLRYGARPAWNARTYEMQLEERGGLLQDAAGSERGEDTELELFIVAPSWREKGVGKALIDAFEEHLRSQGSASYWLQTDSTCNWEWYDAHGYVRIADVELTEAYPMPPRADMEKRAHLFMYMKVL